METNPGTAGRISSLFIQSKLTPVIAIASLLLGVFSAIFTPKEEEPQISVPMIDIRTGAPGYEAKEVEKNVTEPIERAVWGLDGVEYVYSSSQAHHSLVTVRFKVGDPMEPSLVKIHHKLLSLRSELPNTVSSPIVKSYSIDDVPFLTLTFSSSEKTDEELRTLIAPLARELSSTPDLSNVELLGGQKRSIRIIVNPNVLQAKGVSILDVARALKRNQALLPAGKSWGKDEVYDIDVGGRVTEVSDIQNIAIGQRFGGVVHIKDVAQVTDGPEERSKASLLFANGHSPERAVTLSFAKRKGTNVVVLSKQLLERAHRYAQDLPKDIKLTTTRDYGSTAADKSNELIEHLLIATLSVSILIALFMGLRASLVVALAIPVTLALTLAIYYFLGYTLNRVTLFALIFSIGILVDDAIVVVENIERHLQAQRDSKKNLLQITLDAVKEVGNPTILATFTVIAAILPMAFVRGLMGPYMKPIPIGASLAMIVSLFVAFIVTPWAAVKLLKNTHPSQHTSGSRLDRLYRQFMERVLKNGRSSLKLIGFTVLLFILSCGLIYFKAVRVKMLPFDNKNEFQVLIDLPATTPQAKSIEKVKELATSLTQSEHVKKVQLYSGESAPFSFSGMVKHSYLRGSDYQVDLQVVLTEKSERKLSSHQIIESLRPKITEFSRAHNAVTKVLEIPPGPPVLSTLLAEIYGPDEKTRNQAAQEVYDIFKNEPSVVDLDTTLRWPRPKRVYPLNYSQSGQLGVHATEVAEIGQLLFSETPIAILKNTTAPEDISINLSIDNEVRSGNFPFEGQRLASFESGSVRVDQVLKNPINESTPVLYRKNLKPVAYVMSELSGREEAPVYGIFKLAPKIKYPQQTADVPWDTQNTVVKWDGEWFITYEVFRDLGGAFAIVMILIYVLVLGWFRSFMIPFIIMAPIPISLIGILPGHWLTGVYFTATSMIGFIAGAGIIVRNSIILVDFIEHQRAQNMSLKEAVISAGVLRFRPMLLTAAAVVVGSAVMLLDPIFQGLAISLMFGEVAATLLSRFIVPVLYYWFQHKKGENYGR